MASRTLATGDDFARAVHFAYVDTISNAAASESARAYLFALSESPECFRTCLERLHAATLAREPDQLKFVCLTMVQKGIEQRYTTLSEEEKSFIRTSLLIYVRDVLPHTPLPPYIKARVSTCLTAVARFDYPSTWPSFFDDFLSLLPQGPEPAEIFLLTLRTLEEDVIQADTTLTTGSARPKLDAITAMSIKDAMRSGPLPRITEALHGIITSYLHSRPELSAQALQILAVYIEWIELDLVVNAQFFPMIFDLLALEPVRCGAVSVLTALASKGMPRAKRIALLDQMGFVDVLSRCDLSVPEEEQEFDGHSATYVCAMARFAAAMLLHLCAGYDEVLAPSVAVIPDYPTRTSRQKTRASADPSAGAAAAGGRAAKAVFGAPRGGAADEAAGPRLTDFATFVASLPAEEAAALQSTESMCLRVAAAALAALRNPNFEVGMQVTDALSELVTLCKYVGVMAQPRGEVLRNCLEGALAAWAYPAWYRTTGTVLSADSRDDREQRFETYRGQKIERLFRAVVLVQRSACEGYVVSMLRDMLSQVAATAAAAAPSEPVNEAGGFITAAAALPATSAEGMATGAGEAWKQQLTVSNPSPAARAAVAALPFSPIEAVLHMVYVAGDALSVTVSPINYAPWAPALGTLFCSPLSYHANVLVATALYDCLSRFHRVLITYPPLLAPVLAQFTDSRGLGSSVPELRSAAAYQLSRTVRSFTGSPAIVKELLPLLPGLTSGLGEIVASVLGRGFEAGVKGKVSSTDCIHLCECLALLCTVPGKMRAPGQTGIAPESLELWRSCLLTVINPLTALVAAAPAAMASGAHEMVAKRAGQLIQASLTMVKVIPTAEAEAPEVRALIGEACNRVMAVFALAPGDIALRDKVITFIHVVVEVMRVAALPLAGSSLETLLRFADRSSIVRVVELANQIMARFGPDFASVLAAVYLPLIHRVFSCITAENEAIAAATRPDGAAAAEDAAAVLSEHRAARTEMSRIFLLFLRDVFDGKLDSVPLAPANASSFDSIFDTVVSQLETATDAGSARLSGGVLRNLVRFACEHGLISSPGYLQDMVLTRGTGGLARAAMQPGINDRDLAYMGLLRALVKVDALLFNTLGSGYAQGLGEQWIAAGADVAAVTAYCTALTQPKWSLEECTSAVKNVFMPMRVAAAAASQGRAP